MADAKQDGTREGSLRESWKAVRDAIDDRILRACLPLDAKTVVESEGRLYILVDTEFKKEYCVRKLDKL